MMEEDYVDPKAWHGDTWADVKRAKAAPSAPFPLSRFSSLILRSRIIIILWKLSFDNNLCKFVKNTKSRRKDRFLLAFSTLFHLSHETTRLRLDTVRREVGSNEPR